MVNPVLLSWCLGVDQGCGICLPSGPVNIWVCPTIEEATDANYCITPYPYDPSCGYYYRTLETIYGKPNVVTSESNLYCTNDGRFITGLSYAEIRYTYTSYGVATTANANLYDTVCGQNHTHSSDCGGSGSSSSDTYSDARMTQWQIPNLGALSQVQPPQPPPTVP